ncbi:hypothetical protein [Pseudaminobacter soli (ex Li et al. 2025)]|uniref:Uncharacterized protein n=1 Tax=Pseudaminobacter soli (ex Li et al. 2025) TaxID=1295366 RepID=A0A2P7SMK9_9HYPH|nr:hypothetical protein [Mesorhizobium soli]PSJ63698.1 hypothetical protein C7I85_00755 [Mesorhizobium soli]
MKIDVVQMSSRLASDRTISDYDFWRALKTINNELYRLERHSIPIPMKMIYARAIIKSARSLRHPDLYSA